MGFLLNRAKENTATTGTGAVTPSGAVSPFQTWSAAGATANYWYDYLIEDGTAWEQGCGLYNGTTIARRGPSVDPQFASSTGSLLSLSGTATIACVAAKGTLMADGPFMPPISADFTLGNSDGTNISLADDIAHGLVLYGNAPTGATNDRYRYAYKTLPASAAWTVIARLRFMTTPTNYQGIGLLAIESGTSKTFGEINFFNSGLTGLRCHDIRRGTLTAFGADMVTLTGFENWDDYYFRMQYDGTNMIADHSRDATNWINDYTGAATTSFTTRPDRIALTAFNSSTSTGGVNMNCPFWYQNF